MKISIVVVTYLRGGGLSPYKYIGDLLNARLKGNYGSAIKTIEIYPRLPVPKQLQPISDDYFDQWQKSLEELPYIKFRRKLNRFELAFCSKHFNSAEIDDWAQSAIGKKRIMPIGFETIRIAGDEINEALRRIKKRIKQSDDFDVARFLSDAQAALISAPSSIEEWNELAQIAEKDRIR